MPCMKFKLKMVKGVVILKYFFIGCNVIFLALNLYNIGFLKELVTRKDHIEILLGFKAIGIAPAFISGIVSTFSAIFGIWGAIKRKRKVILIYSVVIFVSMIFIITQIISELVTINKFKSVERKNFFKDKLKKYNERSEIAISWDTIQEYMECCGVDNASDWGGNIPRSCCKEPPENKDEKCLDINIFKAGCWDGVTKIVEIIRKRMLIFLTISLIMRIIFFVCACFLAKAFKKEELVAQRIREAQRENRREGVAKRKRGESNMSEENAGGLT